MKVELTDGICRACAARMRSDLEPPRPPARTARRRRWTRRIALVGAAVLAALALTAGSTYELPLTALPATPLASGPATPAGRPEVREPHEGRAAPWPPRLAMSRPSPAGAPRRSAAAGSGPRAVAVYRGGPVADAVQSP